MSIDTRSKAGLLDAGTSLFAGAAAGFLLYAMPEDLLARAFQALRLASFSPHFQPPFGAGLRWAVAAAAGLVTCAFVWSLMKALDRPASPAAARDDEAEAVHLPEPEEAPRLRKADAHPDAPARRPLLAGRDLGEPVDFAAPAEAEEVDEAFDLTEEHAIAAEPEPEPEPAPQPLPSFLVAQEPEPAPEPESASAPPPAPAPATEDPESLAGLMHRFETGLVRKKQALADRMAVDPVPPSPAPAAFPPAGPFVPPAADPAPEPAPELTGPAPVGHRLRSAIADLQRVAGR